MGESRKPKLVCRIASMLILCSCLLSAGIEQPLTHASTTLIPENADGPLLIWKEKAKYYLVIAVDQTGVPGTQLPFTLTDGERVATQFEALGYLPLVEKQLIGPTATRLKVNAALKRIRDLPEWASVIVYYSGHGVASPHDKDVSLQLAGQDDLDYGLGYKVADLIESAKDDTYLGELHLIIDACFSGKGAFTGALTLKELGPKTTILTSSSTTQTSFPITLQDGTQLSAFTQALLEALDSNWSQADDNGDGILRFDEVKTYAFNQLRKWHRQDRIAEPMQPQLVGGHHEEVILAYQRNKVERWHSSSREALTLVALERSLIPAMPTHASDTSEKPEISQEAQLLAQQLTPSSDDPYAQGIKAQAEGRLQDAKILFAEAEALEEESKEQLAKIYLARGRNETYAGNYKDALPWYQKRVALKPTKDPTLLDEFGQAWDRAGKYEDALPFYADALSIREKTLDPNDPDLALSLNNLAGLHESQGKYAEAEPLYQRAIQIRKTALGKDHPALGTSFNDLAYLYQSQGKYAEAEPLFKRTLEIYEKTLGSTHAWVGTALNNLASLYTMQGKYAEAEPLFQRAIRIDEVALGPEHPSVAIRLNNLADLFRTQGKYAEAEPLFQRALRISETALGPEHPSIATRLNNLADLFRAQGKHAEAEPLFQRALRISETALGPEHPSVAIRLNNLADLFRAQGKYAEAEALFQRAIQIRKTALRKDHPALGTSFNDLAILYESQGKYAEAEPLYKRTLEIYEKTLGSTHAWVGTALNNLAQLHKTQGKYAEAEPLFQRAIRIDEVALGPEHPSVAIRLNNLADLFRTQGKYAEAEPLFQRAYGIFKARLGLEHPNTKTVLNNYVEFLRAHGDKAKIQVLVPDLEIVFPGIFAQDSSSKEPSP